MISLSKGMSFLDPPHSSAPYRPTHLRGLCDVTSHDAILPATYSAVCVFAGVVVTVSSQGCSPPSARQFSAVSHNVTGFWP